MSRITKLFQSPMGISSALNEYTIRNRRTGVWEFQSPMGISSALNVCVHAATA